MTVFQGVYISDSPKMLKILKAADKSSLFVVEINPDVTWGGLFLFPSRQRSGKDVHSRLQAATFPLGLPFDQA